MNALKFYASRLFTRVRVEEEGQGLVEYALILALIAVVAITILGTIGTDVVSKLTSIANAL